MGFKGKRIIITGAAGCKKKKIIAKQVAEHKMHSHAS